MAKITCLEPAIYKGILSMLRFFEISCKDV